MALFSLKKKERLSKRGLIDSLFSEGESFVSYPLRFIYRQSGEGQTSSPTQTLFSVSKRKFKKAVERNKLKRRMREAYRLNKKLVSSDKSNELTIAIQFIANKEETFEQIKKGMINGLKKMNALDV